MQIGKFRQLPDRARSSFGRKLWLGTMFSLFCLVSAISQVAVHAQDNGADAADATEAQRWYPVKHFDLRYAQQIGGLTPADQLLETEVELGQTDRGYVAPGHGETTQTIQLAAFEGPAAFSSGALNAITSALAQRLSRQGFDNMLVVPDPRDIDYATGRDRRTFGKSRLTFVAAVDGPAFAISRFELTYAQEHPQHPSLDVLQQVEVPLYETPSGYVAWLPGQDPVMKRPADPEMQPTQPEM